MGWVVMQLTFDDLLKRKKIVGSSNQKKIKTLRIPSVRFAPEVSDLECKKCKLSTMAHPMLRDTSNRSSGYTDVYHLLCIKDALKAGIAKRTSNHTFGFTKKAKKKYKGYTYEV